MYIHIRVHDAKRMNICLNNVLLTSTILVQALFLVHLINIFHYVQKNLLGCYVKPNDKAPKYLLYFRKYFNPFNCQSIWNKMKFVAFLVIQNYFSWVQLKVSFTQKMLAKWSKCHSSEPFFAPEEGMMKGTDKILIFSFFCISKINL